MSQSMNPSPRHRSPLSAADIQDVMQSAATVSVCEGIFWAIDGALNVRAMESAWADLLATHPKLQGRVSSPGNTANVEAARVASFTQQDLCATDPAGSAAGIARHLQTHLQASFRAGDAVAKIAVITYSETQHCAALALHPSICDGWSKGVIVEDLARYYRVRCRGGLQAANAEAASELAQQADGETADDEGHALSFWREKFPYGVSFPELPRDSSASVGETAFGQFSRQSIFLDQRVGALLKQRCSESGVNLSTWLVSAFAAAIARLANAADVPIAVVAAGQLLNGNLRLVGKHAMWLPVPCSFDPQSTFMDFARAAHGAMMDALEHPCGDLFGRLAEAQASTGIAAYPRLTFNLDPDLGGPGNQFEGTATQIELLPFIDDRCELHFSVTAASDNRIRCDLYANQRLFNAESAARWLRLIVAQLGEGVSHPESSIATHKLVLAEDVAQINTWNNTFKQFPAVDCVDTMVEAEVERSGDVVAVEFLDQKITYRELNQRANQLARYLRANGVVNNSRVAICVNRGIPMIVALLATLKAGAAYLPLDPAYPEDRLSYMLKHGEPKVLLTESALLARLGTIPAGVPVVDVVTDSAKWSGLPADNLGQREVLRRHETDLAYVIYTSGSTGEPKGVSMPHRALVNLLHWQLSEPNFRDLKRTAQFAALGFDVAFQEVFSTLCAGGTLVMLREETRLDPTALFAFVCDREIERLFLPFVGLQVLSEGFAAAETHAAGHPRSSRLREVIVAGEQLRIEPRIERLFAYLQQCKLLNHYGPTESHVVTSYGLPSALADWPSLPPIGKPIANSQIYILDALLRPTPIGVAGELYIGGACVANGYLNRADLTSARFVENPFVDTPDAKMYKTGDLARWRSDGEIEYLGRNDFQVKIRGFRVELGEVEARLAAFPGVKDAVVVAREDTPGIKRLVAYVTAANGMPTPLSSEAMRRYMAETLPDYMVPSAFVVLPALPVTPNGKLDRRGLPAPSTARPELSTPYQQPASELETICSFAFAEVLGIDKVGRHDNFFELGGNSLLAMRALEQIRLRAGKQVAAPAIFANPTPSMLAVELGDSETNAAQPFVSPSRHANSRALRQANRGDSVHEPIAIIGMAGRFPGAVSIEALWANLVENKDSISHFAEGALDPAIPHALRADPNYVMARGLIDDVENFDAAFFGISAREAEVMDPQHRIFLEISWECLERAGYAPNAIEGSVGVFAGVHSTTYLQNHVLAHPEAIERVGDFQVMVANEKDYVATRVAYKLNLKGPAVSVQTACSTSLVAIVQAVQQLRSGGCDMALAGAAAVTAPYRAGYRYEEGAMLSRDGLTRTFDADATGTVFSDGAAVVLLKRLGDAIADGDQIYSVIRGVGMNNDGGGKASFTAPSSRGQSAAIVQALADARVLPTDVGYVEAHGTATPLGDPVEIEGLTKAFRDRDFDQGGESPKNGYCRIGSLKSNMGHLVAAAGAAGVIKTSLALRHDLIPASLHFRSANTKIPFADTPFVVASSNFAWPRSDKPRFAGVSSFGVGGTNAHVILEEPPVMVAREANATVQTLRLSARSGAALERAVDELATHLEKHGALDIADVAWTLNVGRARHPHRLAVACDSTTSAVAALRDHASASRAARTAPSNSVELVFVFPGQGAQYAGMGRSLYETDNDFRNAFDAAIAAMAPVFEGDLKALMFGGEADALTPTAITQPATFCIEYALAQMWMARGLVPTLLVGHSVGEFVAATLAGVFSLGDAAQLVAQRGALLQSQPRGSMLSVRMPAALLEPKLPASLSMAAENGPNACVVSGPDADVSAFAAELAIAEIVSKALHTSHAFHSSMMDVAVPVFRELVSTVTRSSPSVPILSTVTGELLTERQAMSDTYWANHLREPVRFSPAIKRALARAAETSRAVCFVEVGPRASLTPLVRQHVDKGAGHLTVATLADAPEKEALAVATAMAHVWTFGQEVNEPALADVRRVLLPTTPFERKRFWLDAKPAPLANAIGAAVISADLPSVSATSSFSTPTLSQSVMEQSTMSSSPAFAQPSRKGALADQVRALFEDVSGLDIAASSVDASFLELGLDSLTLTQAAIQLKKKFKLNITFRQLMEQFRSVNALAGHLDASLPKEEVSPVQIAPAAAAPVAAVPIAAPVAAAPAMMMPAAMSYQPSQPASAIQSVIQQQMQLMAQQLALLSGGAQVAMPAPAVAPHLVAAPSPAPASASVLDGNTSPAATSSPADDDLKAPLKYDVKKAFGAIARIHTTGNALTDRQQARLDAFIRRYTQKTAKSKAYTVAHRAHLADPRVVNNFRPQTKEIIYQIVVEKSKGARLWDLDGNEYVDALNGFGMSLFGWQPDFIEEAIRAQHQAGYDVGPMSPLAGEVAKMVCDFTGFDRAGFCNTGSEAVMAAIRIARTVTGRSLMVVFAGSYHGTFDEVIVRAGRNNKGIPAAPGIMSEAFGNIMVLEYGTPETLEIIRQHADELAAVLVEPVQSRRADFQPKEFLREVRSITEKSGTCLIFDEVITGFRSHPGGVQALFGIRADLGTYGKVVGGGYPIGVIAGKREFMDALDGGSWQYGDDSIPTVGVTYFAGTFVRHPLALAAAKASLQHMKEIGPELQAGLNLRTAAMADELNGFCAEVGAPIAVKNFASLWRTTFTEDHPLQDLLFAMMRSRGVHILDNFPCFFTTAHTADDVAIIKSAFKESVLELQEADLLPRRMAVPGKLLDASKPPVPGARIGKDPEGNPAWFVPNPDNPGKYLRLDA
jgi:amino acid adenylation domain-containing protein